MDKMQGVEVMTSRGLEKWYAIDKMTKYGKKYYLMESEKFGDEVPCIVMDENKKVHEWNCYDTLEEWWEN